MFARLQNMAPKQAVVTNNTLEESNSPIIEPEHPVQPREYVYVWRNIYYYIYLHSAALYAVYLVFTSVKLKTTLFGILLINLGNLGITAGAHRLWSHKSYKARAPLKFFLLILQTLAFQNSTIEWAKDHRVHHKFSETDADPHNAKRGLFFSHMGWLLTKKHPDVKEKGKCVDMSDLRNDPMLSFQHKHYLPLMALVSFVIPTMVPIYCWNETGWNAWHVNLLRYCISLHITWLVNSVAHTFGQKPYDKHINPAQNVSVSFFALGEGWHNYHHTFPWDYKTSEHGHYGLNMTTYFINLMYYLGLAYDLKSAPMDMILNRIQRSGDGTHPSTEKEQKQST